MSSVTLSNDSNYVFVGDNQTILSTLPDSFFQMIYIDPPFNTGRKQVRTTLRTRRSETGNRLGFKGQRYESVKTLVTSYDDAFADYWAFLEPRL